MTVTRWGVSGLALAFATIAAKIRIFGVQLSLPIAFRMCCGSHRGAQHEINRRLQLGRFCQSTQLRFCVG